MTDKIKKTQEIYNLMWNRGRAGVPFENGHLPKMQSVIPEPIVNGSAGIDIGSGFGYDTYVMAKGNPTVKIVSLDLSDGVYKTKKLIRGLNNVWIIKGSVMSLPVKSGVFDFAYSFGVLHHILDPELGLKEIARVVKKGAGVYVYLYEDHSRNRIKYWLVKFVTVLRMITTRLPKKAVYVISYLISPLLVIIVSYPARIMRKFRVTSALSQKMPFNFGTHLFSLSGDIYDRFAAPIEQRFSKKQVYDLFQRNGFSRIRIEQIKSISGWVAWGYKDA
jgi:ubiquinone/menaquinone biosynthesis C-methylase UbiE